MSATEQHTIVTNGHGDGRHLRPSVFLQPIAPPVTLGLWGFFGSTMVLSTWILGWWGTPGPTDPGYFFVFNATIGGLVQFLAGIWSFRARDYVASSLLTMWGTFWIAWGLLHGIATTGVITLAPLSTPQPGFALWFIPLGLFTFLGSIAALSPKHGNFPLWLLLFTVGIGSMLFCIGLWTGLSTWQDIGAWFFVVGACAAWYVGAMVMLRSAWRRVILPIGRLNRASNIPGTQVEFPSELLAGDPGVRQGQA